MKTYLNRFFNWWGNLNLLWFIGFGFSLLFVTKISVGLMLGGITESNTRLLGLDFFSLLSMLLLAPLIETFVFQFLITYLIDRYINKYLLFQVLLSAILFGLVHTYDLKHIAIGFAGGIILSSAFVLYRQTHDNYEAFVAVFLIHFFHNSISALAYWGFN